MSTKLLIVEQFIRTMHQGQVRRNREDYANHPIRVANALIKDGYHKACIVAMLHDVVEDCGELHNLTVEELYLLCDQFLQTNEEREALRLVTKLEGETSKDQIKRIALSGNQLAMLVKKYDAIDNSIMTKEDEDFTRYKLGKDPVEEKNKYESIVTSMNQELKYLEI